MAERTHRYCVTVRWTGNLGPGTSSYDAYGRDHEIASGDKAKIGGSSDPAFRGDSSLWNPEDLLVASLSACHQLWYLALCAEQGVTVTSYVDEAEGSMVEAASGEGQFRSVILKPLVTVSAGSDLDLARDLHIKAHAMCFIARSVNFGVECRPVIQVN